MVSLQENTRYLILVFVPDLCHELQHILLLLNNHRFFNYRIWIKGSLHALKACLITT